MTSSDPTASDSPDRVVVSPAAWDASRDAYVVESPPARAGSRGWVHLLLLVLTFGTMTMAGAGFYLNYITGVGTRPVPPDLSVWAYWVGGLWYSIPALLILGTHEMGHYVACRYYRIPASLPYFIPAPLLLGTLGAVIKMAVPRTRKSLFDVGIAGPIAGFAVAVPAAIFGVANSYVSPIPANYQLAGIELGDPLLLTWLMQLIHGDTPERHMFVMHPTGFGAWFGLLATALNLIPVGQLDGGHIVHALVNRRSRYVTVAAMLVMFTLAATVSSAWVLWALLLAAMLWFFGVDHPPVQDEHVPIGHTRIWLGLFAVVMFVLCFTPRPISPIELLGR